MEKKFSSSSLFPLQHTDDYSKMNPNYGSSTQSTTVYSPHSSQFYQNLRKPLLKAENREDKPEILSMISYENSAQKTQINFLKQENERLKNQVQFLEKSLALKTNTYDINQSHLQQEIDNLKLEIKSKKLEMDFFPYERESYRSPSKFRRALETERIQIEAKSQREEKKIETIDDFEKLRREFFSLKQELNEKIEGQEKRTDYKLEKIYTKFDVQEQRTHKLESKCNTKFEVHEEKITQQLENMNTKFNSKFEGQELRITQKFDNMNIKFDTKTGGQELRIAKLEREKKELEKKILDSDKKYTTLNKMYIELDVHVKEMYDTMELGDFAIYLENFLCYLLTGTSDKRYGALKRLEEISQSYLKAESRIEQNFIKLLLQYKIPETKLEKLHEHIKELKEKRMDTAHPIVKSRRLYDARRLFRDLKFHVSEDFDLISNLVNGTIGAINFFKNEEWKMRWNVDPEI